jgi:hypothetical protein
MDGRFEVVGFNFKKQELICAPLLSKEEFQEKKDRMRIYGSGYTLQNTSFKASELLAPEKGAYYNSVIDHMEKTSEEDRQELRIAGSKEFYKLPEEVKEKRYNLHVMIKEGYGSNSYPMVFIKDKNDMLEIKSTEYLNSGDKPVLNPFSKEGKEAIQIGLDNGLKYNTYDKNDIIETLNTTLPGLVKPVLKAIVKEEKKEQERQEALQVEFERQVQNKMNTDKNHVKKRVHLVR